MTTKAAKNPLKIIPGRGLTGRDIKNRLNNRTLEGQSFGNEHYTMDEEMARFTKMTKVEQITAVKENSKKIKDIQERLDKAASYAEQRKMEAEIERKVQAKLQELGKQQFEKQA